MTSVQSAVGEVFSAWPMKRQAITTLQDYKRHEAAAGKPSTDEHRKFETEVLFVSQSGGSENWQTRSPAS